MPLPVVFIAGVIAAVVSHVVSEKADASQK